MGQDEILGLVGGYVTGGLQQQSQLAQQQQLQQMQIEGQQKMGRFNQELALKHWKDTNYNAQRKEMEKAGLNVGLMYGGGGAGGGTGTGTPAGNVSSSEAKGINVNEGMAMMMQSKALESQIKVNEAQANKLNADAEKISGVDTEEGKARIKNLVIDNALKKIEEQDKNITQWSRWSEIESNAQKANEELLRLARENSIGDATINEQVKLIKEAVINAELKNRLEDQQYTKNGAEMAKWIMELEQKGIQLNQEKEKIELERELRTRGLDQGEIQLWINGAGTILNSLGKIKFPKTEKKTENNGEMHKSVMEHKRFKYEQENN